MRLTSLLALLVAAGCELSVAKQPPPPDPGATHLGLLVPQSGPAVVGTVHDDEAARLAIRQINEAGGVNGRRLDLIVRDSRDGLPEGPQVAVAAVNQLADAGVVAVIGPATSATLLAIADTVVARRLPLIATTATSPAITGLADDDLIWRVQPSDAFQGPVLAELIERDRAESLAVIHRDDAYGNGLARALVAAFAAAGGRVVARVAYPPQKTAGFDAEAAELLASGASAIAVIGFSLDSASILTALHARAPDPRPRLYGCDGHYNSVFLANAPPDMALGMRGATPTSAVDAPTFRRYVEAYRRAVGADPPLATELAYDAVNLVALAMMKGGANTAEAVRANLRDVSRPDSPAPVVVGVGTDELARARENLGGDLDYIGASGRVDFDAAGDPSAGTYALWEVVSAPDGLRFLTRERRSFP